MQVQYILITEFGDFTSIFEEVEDYDNIKSITSNYWSNSFEMTLEDGSFIVFSPEVTKKSILKVNFQSNIKTNYYE